MAKQSRTLIECAFPDQRTLYMAYMPFIKGGGLFIRTTEILAIGTLLDLSVELLDEGEEIVVEGKVVWQTPMGALGNKPCGVGIQLLGEAGHRLVNKIETYLAGMLQSGQITDSV